MSILAVILDCMACCCKNKIGDQQKDGIFSYANLAALQQRKEANPQEHNLHILRENAKYAEEIYDKIGNFLEENANQELSEVANAYKNLKDLVSVVEKNSHSVRTQSETQLVILTTFLVTQSLYLFLDDPLKALGPEKVDSLNPASSNNFTSLYDRTLSTMVRAAKYLSSLATLDTFSIDRY